MIKHRLIKNCDNVKGWYGRDTCLVSIGSNGAKGDNLRYGAKHVLRLNFDDVAPNNRNKDTIGYHYKLFSDFDAKNIAEFIRFYNQCCTTIVFQCEAGISRSVGCCEAFLLHYFGEEVHKAFIKEHDLGNKFVRDKLLKGMIYYDDYIAGKKQ